MLFVSVKNDEQRQYQELTGAVHLTKETQIPVLEVIYMFSAMMSVQAAAVGHMIGCFLVSENKSPSVIPV